MHRASPILLGCLLCLASFPGSAQTNLRIDADFPGGNIVLEKVEGDVVFMHQDLRDTVGTWFYWHFRARGAAGRTLTFQFTKGNVIGVRGPAITTDQGQSWRWLGTNEVRNASFQYAFSSRDEEVRFCFAIPYVESNLNEFLARHQRNRALKREVLCETRNGRKVELLRVGDVRGWPRHRVVVTARHHACESMANYVMEGLLDFVLTDSVDGAWLRKRVEFMAIPFMDKDGVEQGDQGKNRAPHDHNRDYVFRLYPSVRALAERVPPWAGGKLRAAIDLHCPWIRGEQNETLYFVGGPDAGNWKRVQQFSTVLESAQRGPLVYRQTDNLPFGKAWNTVPADSPLKSFGRWAAELPDKPLSCSAEIPYANSLGIEVNRDSARAFGGDLARALRQYLASGPPKASGQADE